jgi:phage terminase small subunit
MPLKSGRKTVQEAAFTGFMAMTGDPVYSAQRAGYAHPNARAHDNLQKPEIVAAVRKAQIVRLNNDLLPKALDLLERVILDDKEATRNRLTAAQVIVKYSLGGKDDGESKEPHEMTPEELQARIDQLRRAQADKARPVIEHDPSPGDDVFG